MTELNSNNTAEVEFTDAQMEFFEADNYKERAFFGGYGSGKSVALVWTTLKYCIMYPGNEWLYCRSTYPELEGTTIPDFFKYCPKELILSYNKKERIVTIKTSGNQPSRIIFKALDDPQKVESFNVGGISIDQVEGIPEELFIRFTGGRLRLASVPKRYLLVSGNPRDNWVKARYWDTAKKTGKFSSVNHISFRNPVTGKQEVEDVFVINTKTTDNPFLPKDYIAHMYATFPEKWVKRFIEGSWQAFEGMAITELDKERHFIKPFPINKTGYIVWGAYDYGYNNPFCFLIFARSREGNIFCIAEDYGSKVLIPEQVKRMHHLANSCGLDLTKMKIYVDPTIMKHDRTEGKSVYDELMLAQREISPFSPLCLIPGNNNQSAGLLLINRLFKVNKLFVFSDLCPNVCRELPGIRWKEQTLKMMQTANPKEELVDKDNHTFDCFKYGLNNSEVDLLLDNAKPTIGWEQFNKMNWDDPSYDYYEDYFDTIRKNYHVGVINPHTGWRG